MGSIYATVAKKRFDQSEAMEDCKVMQESTMEREGFCQGALCPTITVGMISLMLKIEVYVSKPVRLFFI